MQILPFLLFVCPFVSFLFVFFIIILYFKRTTLTCTPNLGRCTGPHCPGGWRFARTGNSTKKNKTKIKQKNGKISK
jgi:hypothetical protein